MPASKGTGHRAAMLLTLALLISSLPVRAALTWHLAADIKAFDYRETREGQRLDREQGWLPGLAVGLEWERGSWSLIPELAWHGGQVDYEGQTQAGQPHSTDTDTRLLRSGLLAAYRLPLAPLQWSLLAGIHHLQWQRNIQANGGVAGIDERYRWQEGSLGLQLALPAAQPASWRLQLHYLTILSPRLTAEPAGFDPLSLQLGASHGWRVLLSLPLPDAAGGHWSVEPYWERWRFGQSAARPLTRNGLATGWLAREPDSLSQHWGLRLRYRFGG